jgi:hypothetical protein
MPSMRDRPFGCPPDRPSKYRAVKTVVDGITFDSKREAARYAELRLLEKRGFIRQLKLQPEFVFMADGKPMFKYRADFRYFEGKGCVIEDVKGVRTAVYRLKKKLIEAQFNVKITEVS